MGQGGKKKITSQVGKNLDSNESEDNMPKLIDAVKMDFFLINL